jgi:hypothetical protein
MKFSLILSFALSTTNTWAQSHNHYVEAQKLLNLAPTHIKEAMESAPSTYVFKSQFDGKDSVNYKGQSFRQILIEELKTYMSALKRGNYPGTTEQSRDAVMSYLNFNNKSSPQAPGAINGNSFFQMKAYELNQNEATIAEGYLYDDLQNPGKKLLDKLAGNDNPLRRGKLYGWNDIIKTPEELLLTWVKEFSLNSTEGDSFTVPNGNLPAQRIDSADTTADGKNLTELTQKFLQGAVSYSQAAEDYLSTDLGANKGLMADNEAIYEKGSNYTALEHFFDEAYGYFGGTRDFSLYTDEQLAKSLSIDTNADGEISLLNEKNHGLAKNYARVDLAAKDKKLDLTKEVIIPLIRARHLITVKPDGYKNYVIANAQLALGTWEKTIAALSIIYINNLSKMYAAYGTESYNFKTFTKFWSELKGFSLGLQFNPKAILSDADFDKFQALIGEQPVLAHSDAQSVENYKKNLIAAREIMAKAYGFSEINVLNW